MKPPRIEEFMLATHLPCVACTKRLTYTSDVQRDIYKTDYRIRDSVKLLNVVEIELFKLEDVELKKTSA